MLLGLEPFPDIFFIYRDSLFALFIKTHSLIHDRTLLAIFPARQNWASMSYMTRYCLSTVNCVPIGAVTQLLALHLLSYC